MSDLYLGIDTATPYLALALWSPERGYLAGSSEPVERRHASRLLPTLEEALEDAGAGRGDLTALAVGTGPGSYTGLRVGVATAKGLARALSIPLAGCDTLAALAFAGLADGEEGLAAIDARRGRIYVGRYRRIGVDVMTLESPRKALRQEVVAGYPDLRLVESIAPDAGYVARQAVAAAPLKPLYL